MSCNGQLLRPISMDVLSSFFFSCIIKKSIYFYLPVIAIYLLINMLASNLQFR